MFSSVEKNGPDVTATAGERYSRGCHLGINTKIVALAATVGFLYTEMMEQENI